MWKRMLFSFILSLSLVLPFASYADDAPATTTPASCGCDKNWQAMAKALNLTQDQQDKIKAIKENAKASMKDQWQQMKSLREEMKALVTSDNLDQGKLDSLVQQKTTLMQSILKAKIIMKNQMYHVLNDQQKQQFQTMMAQWQGQKGNKNCKFHF